MQLHTVTVVMGMSAPHMYLWLVLARNDIALVRSCARTWTTFAVILAVEPRVVVKSALPEYRAISPARQCVGSDALSREQVSV